ncbi:hypothetical protein [Nocardioides sp.]|uniref:hypothetical protein n=1 Tax=Nocardioides sp. TaxID=35761 RepID=UPI002ED7BCE1
MDETWTTLPSLGLVPHFHGDPAEGGAPLASADGHWWWTGTRWTPVHVPTLEDAAAETAAHAGTAQPAPLWAEAS